MAYFAVIWWMMIPEYKRQAHLANVRARRDRVAHRASVWRALAEIRKLPERDEPR